MTTTADQILDLLEENPKTEDKLNHLDNMIDEYRWALAPVRPSNFSSLYKYTRSRDAIMDILRPGNWYYGVRTYQDKAVATIYRREDNPTALHTAYFYSPVEHELSEILAELYVTICAIAYDRDNSFVREPV